MPHDAKGNSLQYWITFKYFKYCNCILVSAIDWKGIIAAHVHSTFAGGSEVVYEHVLIIFLEMGSRIHYFCHKHYRCIIASGRWSKTLNMDHCVLLMIMYMYM